MERCRLGIRPYAGKMDNIVFDFCLTILQFYMCENPPSAPPGSPLNLRVCYCNAPIGSVLSAVTQVKQTIKKVSFKMSYNPEIDMTRQELKLTPFVIYANGMLPIDSYK